MNMHAITDAEIRCIRLLLFFFDGVDDAVHRVEAASSRLPKTKAARMPLLLWGEHFHSEGIQNQIECRIGLTLLKSFLESASCSADLEGCCMAGFPNLQPFFAYPTLADWEVGDTAGLETCATGCASTAR